MRKLMAAVVGTLILGAASSSSASVQVSGHAWVGRNSTDDGYITHNQGYAYNTDTSAGRWVVAAFQQTVNDSSPTATFYVQSSTSSTDVTCYLYSRNVDTNSLWYDYGSASGTSYTTIDLSLSLTSGPYYAHSAACYLPAKSGSNYSYIYSAQLT